MASSFDRWEKDPFFSAAEEVQASADRMESTYRTWMHAKKDASSMWDSEELRRDVNTALGTTKWQLEEFERAVNSSYTRGLVDDARGRHREFIAAIQDQISKIDNSLKDSAVSEGRAMLPWVRLDEGECSELALFLSGPSVSENRSSSKDLVRKDVSYQETDIESATESSKTAGQNQLVVGEEKRHGHRRTASASADIGAWTVTVSESVYLQDPLNEQAYKPPRKVPSFSGLLSSMESASKLKWSKNGFRKLKLMDHQGEHDPASSKTPPLTRGIKACYEKGKSCLENCDDCYEKQINGWLGAIQRQLQRSQYQMQYSRPLQVTVWVVLILGLIVLVTLRTI